MTTTRKERPVSAELVELQGQAHETLGERTHSLLPSMDGGERTHSNRSKMISLARSFAKNFDRPNFLMNV